MQATVHGFDPATSSGSVLTDAGLVIPIAPGALEASGLRQLRLGQRLSVTTEGSGAEARVTALWLEGVARISTDPARP